MSHLTIGTARAGSGYTGALRDGRTVIFRCGHTHRNRDQSSGTNGMSAYDCVRALVIDSRMPDRAERSRVGYREREASIRRLYGAMAWPADMPTAGQQIEAYDIAARHGTGTGRRQRRVRRGERHDRPIGREIIER